ncbi:MAG: hypothetical protein MUE97_05325 [Phycisphaerales bacterium]|jgi:MYXO-CTERM domain-containing protein|nr:hypothetical protein [Phycisphaerales bacterium]
MARMMTIGVSMAAVLATAAASLGQGVINPATTVASIEYRRNAAGPVTVAWGPAGGPAWASPNFITSGIFTDNQPLPASPNFNVGSTSVSFNTVNPNPGIAPLGTVIVVPQTSRFGQTDPQGVLPRASLTINFQIDIVTPPGNVPFTFRSIGGVYPLTYNIPAGSFGQFEAEINYVSILTGQVVQPQQTMNFGGAGFAGQGVANLAFPGGPAIHVVPAGDGVRVQGFLRFTVDNDAGAVSLDLIPTPGAAALLGLGGLVASRRRR